MLVALQCLPATRAAAANEARAGHGVKARQTVAVQDDRAGAGYGRRDDVLRFAAALAEAQGLDRDWVEATLAQARYQPAVARLIMPPAVGTAKNWAAYKARFVEPQRIRAGLAFWAAHQAWLEAAQARFGVPAEIVVGIIGVETFYGRMTGNFRVLDALATLAFDFPVGRKDRSEFFRDELAQFLMLARREGVAPELVLGSYAGAIGLGQFMPSSIRRHAIDFDRDGQVDMTGSAADVIGSVANYLAAFGWQPGMPTHYAVLPPLDTAERAALLLPDIRPSFTPAQMVDRGAVLGDEARAHAGALALVELHNGSAAPSHVAGTENFYAVTRYNWSSYYALAVIELGRAIKARRPAPPAPPTALAPPAPSTGLAPPAPSTGLAPPAPSTGLASPERPATRDFAAPPGWPSSSP